MLNESIEKQLFNLLDSMKVEDTLDIEKTISKLWGEPKTDKTRIFDVYYCKSKNKMAQNSSKSFIRRQGIILRIK